MLTTSGILYSERRKAPKRKGAGQSSKTTALMTADIHCSLKGSFIMMLPAIFGENLFDDFMDDAFEREFFGSRNPLYGKHSKNIMKTDVKETDNGYELDIDLPGFKKEEISAHLENGYLTVSAAKGLDKDEKDKEGRYIRRERYSGSMTRSFYVGNAITEQDIKAKYEDGILSLSIPKKDEKAVESKKYIAIEGK